ncbi:MAG TPA: choice-of-anchor tandem repeat GloVer-containing protein [Edaphobacter sp.]|uniref:choice-of-anchor tandem repeat GloVer-containing protein n=1 Tax=Edaphobacter sp. TaxID=1934404 RepID=UPI002BE53ADE|nr:choice-of-anchor tandem repeat GloVer-containing protein [Edaphobacter sp.]HUZ93618.1 choice-of-anchor tandem repeat GloVer-containing protein [Edaphobacter sp.]
MNGTSGGSSTYGAVNASGLYQAPATAPAAYLVTVSATSTADSTKSGSFSVLIAGTIATATQPIVASTGGTISLPGGNSVTIPAGTLTANTTATLQLSSVATQPTNPVFGGIGPSLLMSFSPAVGGVGAAVSEPRFRPNAASNATAAAGTSGITFVLQGGQGLSATQLQNAFGVLNVNNGTNNFFSLPSTYDATSNATTLTVDPSMIEPSSALEVGIAVAVGNGLTTASLTQWDDSKHLFTNSPTCPTGSTRVLVLVHGILSDAQDSFGGTNGVASCALKAGTASCTTHGPYDTVYGINYDWSQPIGSSSLDMANSLNSLFSSSCSFSGTIDIEAHSEGTLVALTSAKDLSPSVKAKLAHVVLVAGPIDGTPLASDADGLLTLHLNQPLDYIATVIDPEITQNQKMQLKIIAPELAPVNVPGSAAPAAQAAAANNLSQTEILAVGGDQSFLQWWGIWTRDLFAGAPNDGVVPVASALPSDSSLPNLVRLVGNDPGNGDYSYPFDHIDLVNNQNVMSDVFKAVSDGGETAQVSMNITPPSATLTPGQAITLTANVANMLNPQLQWSVSGGSVNGTVSPVTPTTAQYTAPTSPGGPFDVSASILALPVPFPPAQMTVNLSPGQVTISPSTVAVPGGESQTFMATVIGGGNVTWSVEEGATGGTISNEGIYTAPNQSGTYHVIATNSSDTSQSAMATVNVVAGPSITILHSFNHTTEGANPWAAPVFGSDGNLYGVTEAGGDLSCGYISSLAGCGTIYKSDTSGNVTTLYSFSGTDGAYPVASLTQTPSGVWYGTTVYGGLNTSECAAGGTSTPAGCGTVFNFSAAAGFTSIYSFGPFSSPLGVGPDASLAEDSSGVLYGANEVGANTSCTGTLGAVAQSGCGSIFSVDTSNAFAPLHTFSGSEGAYPAGGLLRLSDGDFYGTTAGGGVLTCSSYATLGCGTVFQMAASGAIKTLHSFTEQDGAFPDAALISGTDGSVYGTTLFGGTTACSGGAPWQGCGTIFKIDAAGNFTLLHSFSGPDGAYPAQLMQASDGYFYGTTEGGGDASCAGRYGPGCGTVFRMDSFGNVTILYSFTGQSDGSWPESALIQGPDGSLYGTTAYGGVNDDGVIFRISNLTALTAAKAQFETPEVTRGAITPLLRKRAHIGIPSPSVPAQP